MQKTLFVSDISSWFVPSLRLSIFLLHTNLVQPMSGKFIKNSRPGSLTHKLLLPVQLYKTFWAQRNEKDCAQKVENINTCQFVNFRRYTIVHVQLISRWTNWFTRILRRYCTQIEDMSYGTVVKRLLGFGIRISNSVRFSTRFVFVVFMFIFCQLFLLPCYIIWQTLSSNRNGW